MKTRLIKFLSAAVVGVASISSAMAAVITVPNFSFENPLIGAGDSGSGGQYLSTSGITSWTTGGDGSSGLQLATAPPMALVGVTGNQAAWLNGATTLTSSAGLHTIALGDQYTLTVAAAGRKDYNSVGFQFQLTDASGTPFASSITIIPDNVLNTFGDYTITYTAVAGNVGQELRIKLLGVTSGPNQTSFDNVRLDVIPEPSTSAALLGGLALLGPRRRRA